MTFETLNLIIDQNAAAALAGDESAIYNIQWAEEQLSELRKIVNKLESK
jgi:hypothetical protein